MSKPFLMWFDDTRGVTLADKVRDAAAAYRDRFGVEATTALVSTDEGDAGPLPLPATATQLIRRNTVWVRREETT